MSRIIIQKTNYPKLGHFFENEMIIIKDHLFGFYLVPDFRLILSPYCYNSSIGMSLLFYLGR